MSSKSSDEKKPAPSETELSEKDLGAVSGGAIRRSKNSNCSETEDTGIMGCPG